MVTVETLIERMQKIYPNIKIAEDLTVLGLPSYSVAVAAGMAKSYRDTGYAGFEVSYSGKVQFPWCGSIWEAEGVPKKSFGPDMPPRPSAIKFRVIE
jgi:hypothetical protein